MKLPKHFATGTRKHLGASRFNFIMYKHALRSVKPPRVRRLTFDRVARLFRTRGARNYDRRVCIRHAYTQTSVACACTGETGVDEKVKAGEREREEGEGGRGNEDGERWNNRKVVKRGCCRRQVEAGRGASVREVRRKLGPEALSQPPTTRDFAVYVLCRVDTRRDILTRQTAAVAQRVGISPGWYVYGQQRRSQPSWLQRFLSIARNSLSFLVFSCSS